MSQVETTLTVTLTGAIADWLQDEADRNTRTASQHVMHILAQRKAGQERLKQAAIKRKARRETLFGASSKRVKQQAA